MSAKDEGYLGPEEFCKGAEALLELSLIVTDLACLGMEYYHRVAEPEHELADEDSS